jgi:hypothetical protein
VGGSNLKKLFFGIGIEHHILSVQSGNCFISSAGIEFASTLDLEDKFDFPKFPWPWSDIGAELRSITDTYEER